MAQFGVIFILYSLPLGISGQDLTTFLTSHYADIENYIMTGYGDGWKHCDNLIIQPNYRQINGNAPSLVMNVETMQSIDISSTFGRAHCIVLVAHAIDTTTLAQLIQFGWKTIQHKRIGIILTMGSNVTLESASNTTKLPFILASELSDGTKQFLCPAIARNMPSLQSEMCGKSSVSLIGKTVTVGVYGHWPWVHMGYMIGVDVMLLNLLKEKMRFNTKVELTPSFNAAFDMVSKVTQSM